MKTLCITVFFSFLLVCCKSNNIPQATQGVAGKVIWFEGNLMPSPDQPAPKGKPVVRDVYVYKLTNINQTNSDGVFFSDIQTDLVTKIKSDKNGEFKVDLPPGEYSFFVKEEKGLFANGFDGYNNINKIEVVTGEYNSVTLKIDYMAAY